MKTLKEAFLYISFTKFCKDFIGLDPQSGIRHTLSGIPTTKGSKPREFKPEERVKIKKALIKFSGLLIKIAEGL